MKRKKKKYKGKKQIIFKLFLIPLIVLVVQSLFTMGILYAVTSPLRAYGTQTQFEENEQTDEGSGREKEMSEITRRIYAWVAAVQVIGLAAGVIWLYFVAYRFVRRFETELSRDVFSGEIIEDGETKNWTGMEDRQADVSEYMENASPGSFEVSRVSQISQQRHDPASKAKSEFLSRMSHEIRTPLNGIIGMTEIALGENQDREKMTDCLRKIQTSSDYLLGLINDVLDMAKIENGKMTLEAENFSMTELYGLVYDLIAPQAEEKSIQFVCDIRIKHEWFQADKLRISQILINLLENAIQFTGENGKVVLTIREEDSKGNRAEIFFSVSDTGIGIGKEDQERIFHSFEQTRSSVLSGKNGTGLGLSISSRLIKLMGSEIRLESEPGKGSTFCFTLSLPIGTVPEEEMEEEKVFFDGYRVLVVEDVELNAEIAQCILEGFHFHVDCVYDGEQAVRRMEETQPWTYDLILMDIMMPVMDGLDATKVIRGMEREDCKKIPIIAMSANEFDDDLKKSVECGMDGHLAKPVEVEKMYRMFRDVLSSSKKFSDS